MTITSFTCTFPVVGGLLGDGGGRDLLYPVIGLATFASVLAFPFLLLALSPGLLAKMPKSGDWMNTVKVVGGLIEIGAAFKFINTAECVFVVPSEAWFNAYTVLSIWVIMLLDLRDLPARPVPDRPRLRGGQGRTRPDRLRLGLPERSPSSWPPRCSADRRRTRSGS